MEHSSNTRIVSIIIILAAVIGSGYLLSSKKSLPVVDTANLSLVVTVENTPMVNGTLPLPPEFPEEIPHEDENILESSTTYHPADGARQLSISYLSPRNYADLHYEYENYMRSSGYVIEESSSSDGNTMIHGKRGEEELFINVKSSEDGALVEVSYLSR